MKTNNTDSSKGGRLGASDKQSPKQTSVATKSLPLRCRLGWHKLGRHHVNLDGQIYADCLYSNHIVTVDATEWGRS